MSDTTESPGKTFRQMVEEARSHIKMLSPADVKKIIDSGGAMVVDVGEPWQIAERGTIPGARNITRGELEIKADTELPRRLLELQDRDQKIILTCGAGGRATLCAKALQEMGFTDVWVIARGCRGWQEAGYELGSPNS
jgi:rhodanese-related sulfurtransferase